MVEDLGSKVWGDGGYSAPLSVTYLSRNSGSLGVLGGTRFFFIASAGFTLEILHNHFGAFSGIMVKMH